MITEEEMATLAGGEDVSAYGLTLVEKVKITPDSDIIPEVGYIIYKDQNNELFKYYYYVCNHYGVTYHDPFSLKQVELKPMYFNELFRLIRLTASKMILYEFNLSTDEDESDKEHRKKYVDKMVMNAIYNYIKKICDNLSGHPLSDDVFPPTILQKAEKVRISGFISDINYPIIREILYKMPEEERDIFCENLSRYDCLESIKRNEYVEI